MVNAFVQNIRELLLTIATHFEQIYQSTCTRDETSISQELARQSNLPELNYENLCLPFLVVQTHKFLGSDSLALLLSNFWFKILRWRDFWSRHPKLTLARFGKNFGPSQTQDRKFLSFLVCQTNEFLGSDAVTLLGFSFFYKILRVCLRELLCKWGHWQESPRLWDR